MWLAGITGVPDGVLAGIGSIQSLCGSETEPQPANATMKQQKQIRIARMWSPQVGGVNPQTPGRKSLRIRDVTAPGARSVAFHRRDRHELELGARYV
jgi:hypothetical protein